METSKEHLTDVPMVPEKELRSGGASDPPTEIVTVLRTDPHWGDPKAATSALSSERQRDPRRVRHSVGPHEGAREGDEDGAAEGRTRGACEGTDDGSHAGVPLGLLEILSVSFSEGEAIRLLVGQVSGFGE